MYMLYKIIYIIRTAIWYIRNIVMSVVTERVSVPYLWCNTEVVCNFCVAMDCNVSVQFKYYSANEYE